MQKSSPKILIVEDEWIIANDIKTCLLRLGYSVPSIVATGEEAIEKSESERPDLIIMDIVLQGSLDGTETAKTIISSFDIPVVFLTAYTDKEILKKAKKTAAYGYLLKPFKESQLKATIALALSKHNKDKKQIKDREQLEQIATEYSFKLKLFSEITEKSPVGVQILDADTQIIYSNSALEEVYGYSQEDLIGINFNKLNADAGFADEVIFPSIEKTGRWDGELLIRNKAGDNIPISLAAFTFNREGEQPAGTIGIIRDLTKQKESEETVRKSEEKYRKLIETANDAILIADAETGIIIDANNKSEELLGIPVEKIIGMHQSKLHPAEEADRYTEIFKEHVLKGDGIVSDLYVVSKSGKKIPVDISASITEIRGKKVIQGVFRDITERRLAEDELKKHRSQLEELVKSRTSELIEANKELIKENNERIQIEKKLLDHQKQLQSLTSQISLIEENEKRRIATELHDCIGQNLALSKIKLGQLGKSANSDDLKNDIGEILKIIEQAITETRTLTFELSPPILYELGLSQAIKWLIDQFRNKHGLEISLEDDGLEKPFENSIRLFLFQAVRELLVNTVKHSNADFAKIQMIKNNDKLQITVEDNGTGFSNPSVDYKGYGLFNIRERMNHINGRFEIKSVPGRGTKVTLVAPFKIDNKPHNEEHL
ncbi:MAG: PAS domain S-box protein [Thermodesulfovibrionia bacterium]|nr:PAS domain S-box protein [Thermodesulfovibrionia bacterium]